MNNNPSNTPLIRTSPAELSAREELHGLFRSRSTPDDEPLVNVGLYTRSSLLAKLLFPDEPDVSLPGVITVFDTSWGRDVVVLYNLRAVHEHYNVLRKVSGFDSLEGHPQLSRRTPLRHHQVRRVSRGPGLQGSLRRVAGIPRPGERDRPHPDV